MNSKKLFFAQCAALALVLVGLISSVYLGTKMLSKENTNLTNLKSQASELERVQASLVTAKKDVANYQSIEQIAKTVVPQEKDQARTVREIITLANESDIAISNVNFPTSNLGGNKGASAGASNSSTSGANTQTKKVDGINNVERLEITVTSDSARPVLYSNFTEFLEKLEQNRRTAQVSSINVQPVEGGNLVTFTLVLNVYIKK